MKRLEKIAFVGLFLALSLFGAELDLKKNPLHITYVDSYDVKTEYNITRDISPKCKDVGIATATVWGGNMANSAVPNECKKTYVTTVGKIAPSKIHPDIATVGEYEVLEFMKKAQTDKSLLLIDARLPNWYEQLTIPTAINLPFPNFDKAKNPAEFGDVLEAIGVSQKMGVYDFSNAKTLMLFCNASWCPQSTWAMENLLKIGFPAKKLNWYRGGLEDWTLLNLTTVVPK
jgi:rhodanese-related sulfurtransferase